MSEQEKKNLKSRLKRIFSPSKSLDTGETSNRISVEEESKCSEDCESDSNMESTQQPSKPNRKGGKSRIPSANTSDIEQRSSVPAEVHGQSKSPQPKGIMRQSAVSNLAEIAQLTIQNERLSRDNQLLRKQNMDLASKSGLPASSRSVLRFSAESTSNGQDREFPTVESLLLDRELLENLVRRLNVELGRYETRLRQLEKETIPKRIYTDEFTKEPAPAWCRADPNTLAPLFNAYDEALMEKDQVIEEYEEQVKKLGAELREILAENDRLHEALDEVLKKEAESREEADRLEKDVNNLHRENVILLEKLETEKAKHEDMSEEYCSKMAQFQEQEALVIQKQMEIKALAREYGILEKQLAQARIEIENRVSAKHHEDSLAECRKLLEQLKSSYNEDCQKLKDENKTLLIEKVNSETKLRSVTSELCQNEVRIQGLEKLLRKAEARSEQLQMKLVGAESCRDSSVRELHQLMAVAERLAADQEVLLQQLHLHQGTNRRLSVLRTSLKSVRKELPVIERQLKAQEDGVERMKDDHQREMIRLHSLLRQKDHAIKQLQQERKSTCDELEMMWRAAGFENLTIAERDTCQPHSLPETHRKISSKDL